MSVHRQTLAKLVKDQEWKRGIELGVDRGILFNVLLRSCPGLYLTGVDTFPDRERSRKAFETVRAYPDRSGLLEMTTREASELYQDGHFDFVFIDADHSYEAVADDIACWRSKVRTGGWLGGHDYSPKFPGVIKAVDEAYGYDSHVWPGDIWGVWV
jgi:predicted O-methyltransferase YrrM